MGVVAASNAGCIEAWACLAVLATAYASYWDVIKDWGLGQASKLLGGDTRVQKRVCYSD